MNDSNQKTSAMKIGPLKNFSLRALLGAALLCATAVFLPQRAAAQSNVTVTGGVLVNPTATVFATSNAAAFYAAISNSIATQIIAALTNANGYTRPVTISPPSSAVQAPYYVTISCPERQATIYFTTNGSTPTSSSTVYTNGFWMNAGGTIIAYSSSSGRIDSAPVTNTITTYNYGSDRLFYYGQLTNTTLTTQAGVLSLPNSYLATSYQGPLGLTNTTGYGYFAYPAAWDRGLGFAGCTNSGSGAAVGLATTGTYTNGNGVYFNLVNVKGEPYHVYQTSSGSISNITVFLQ